MNTSYIALGSNIEPKIEYLNMAIALLINTNEIEVEKKSAIYETEPVGYQEQDQFLNMVIQVNTSLNPGELMDKCQRIERELGRKREIRWGPRTIDLDILTYNQENIESEHLIIPHPRIHERAFVLIPLAELDNQYILPNKQQSVSELLQLLPEQEKKGVVKWKPKTGEEESVHLEN